jgi:hypothetical protein
MDLIYSAATPRGPGSRARKAKSTSTPSDPLPPRCAAGPTRMSRIETDKVILPRLSVSSWNAPATSSIRVGRSEGVVGGVGWRDQGCGSQHDT